MASNDKVNGVGPAGPPVVLDNTLHDLLAADQPPGRPIESVCLIKPTSDEDYGGTVPLSDKYIIHASQADDQETLAHMQLEVTTHLLGFFVGPMDVIFLAAEGHTDDSTLSKEAVDKNGKESFAVIQESQRPVVRTYANVDDLLKNHDGATIRWAFAADFAERLPHLHHPELVYELNSKRWLAITDELRSANDVVIDCEISCPSHQVDCSDGQKRWYYGGSKCSDCTAGAETEKKRILNILEKAKVPFVLKLTQSLSSVGTMIVQKEEDRKDVLETIDKYLSTYLLRITKENAHLMTTSLIHSEFIPGKTMALNLHVNRDGSIVFLGACHQLSTGESGRQATNMTYSKQTELEKKYRKILNDVGKALHNKGYHGPVGADVMEDPDNGRLFAIDLNVRVPLSLLLILLTTHFTSRGFDECIVYECTLLTIPREKFEETFAKEFEEARMVLLGSTCVGGKTKKWAYGMVLAGENHDAINKLSDRILEYEAA